MLYLLLKSLHVLSVVVFLGNIITGMLWKAHGDRRGTPRDRAQAIEGIILCDRWFTLPGVILILITGFALAFEANYPILGTFWILWSLVLFGVSGAVFNIWVAPTQKKLLAVATAGIHGHFETAEYDRLSSKWMLWGGISTLTPLIAVFLMVMKPV